MMMNKESSRLTEELQGLTKRAMNSSIGKKSEKTTMFFQATVIYNQLQQKRNFLDKPFYVGMLFVSPEVFMTETEAIQFMPFFIKRLMDENKVGPEILLQDKSVNPAIAVCGVSPLYLTQMERNLD